MICRWRRARWAVPRGCGAGTSRNFPILAATATTNTATASGSSASSPCWTNTASLRPSRSTRRWPTTIRGRRIPQSSRRLERHADLVEGDHIGPERGGLGAYHGLSPGPALVVLLQIERHDTKLHRLFSRS